MRRTLRIKPKGKRFRYITKEVCEIACCGKLADTAGKCAACYSNVRYHTSKGGAHLRLWAKIVQVKERRVAHMMELMHIAIRSR